MVKNDKQSNIKNRKSSTVKKIKKEIKNELEKENNPILTKPYLINKEKLIESRNKKILMFIEIFAVCAFSIIMLTLLCNRTFFSRHYKTRKIDINIPLMMFFKSDDGNTLTLKTLRKTRYIEEFFSTELDKYTRYDCNGYSFYYDDLNNYAIYNIEIRKKVAVKEIKINYASGDANCLCSVNLVGKEAEKLCLK